MYSLPPLPALTKKESQSNVLSPSLLYKCFTYVALTESTLFPKNLSWRTFMLEQHPNQMENMLLKYSTAMTDYEGLLKFCHTCNLLVGFDYFVNPKSFWCCFELAFAESEFKSQPTQPQMKAYKI
jgi:hypothetical protein